jgi:hypothetical protein
MKRTPIRRVSTKRAKQLKEYMVLRSDYLAAHRTCELCKCAQSKDIHHRAGRVGTRLNDTSLFMALCRECHDWVHSNPAVSYEKGYLLRK